MTQLVTEKVIFSQVDNDLIIKSCFEPCRVLIRKKVEKFLESDGCKCKTLNFQGFRVRLEKI